jgi:hypothetical protein
VPSPKVLMVIVGLYLAPFCYYSGFFFLRRNPQTAVPIGVVNVGTFCVIKQKGGCLYCKSSA